MQITVRMFGRFRQQFWDRKDVVVGEGTVPALALHEALAGIPGGISMMCDENGQVRAHIILMVNRKRIGSAEANSLVLHDGDELAVLPPVAGG